MFAVEIVETGQHLYHDDFCRVLCEYLAFIYDLGKQSSDEIVGYKVLVFSSINGYTSVINVRYDIFMTYLSAIDDFFDVVDDYIVPADEYADASDEEKTEMCRVVTESGADFIKTSTGFSKGGATREDIAVMIYRAVKQTGLELDIIVNNIPKLSDLGEVKAYAVDAIKTEIILCVTDVAGPRLAGFVICKSAIRLLGVEH